MGARRTVAAISVLVLAGCGRSAGRDQRAQPPAPPPSADARTLLAELPAPYSRGDLANGELHFHLCMSCHTVAADGPDMTGPNLYGVFGRKVASRPGYAYSGALKTKAWTWDAAHLDGWLKDPRTAVPGTKMSFYGLRDDQDRIDTIAYLKVASGGGGT